jgi:hypothetical protein
VGANLQ